MSLEWLLEDTFTKLDRAFLLENQTRKKLEDYFNTIIDEFRAKNEAGDDGQRECKTIVRAALAYHEKHKGANNGVCLFGKYHDLLYVAANLCYARRLPDADLVCTLLRRIYACERTFEKFFECAIFGPKVTQLISGWRSYYKTPADNLNACLYFARQASGGRLTCADDDERRPQRRRHQRQRHAGPATPPSRRRFVDVPMRCYEMLSPLKTAVKAENWELAAALLRCGAVAQLPADHRDHERYSVFGLFVQKLERYGAALLDRQRPLLDCFRMLVRAVPTTAMVAWSEDESSSPPPPPHDDDAAVAWLVFAGELGLHDVQEPRSLKHLARCAARDHLAGNHLLPAQAETLGIPKVLERYINLETD